MIKYILIFLSYFDFTFKCDDVVEYSTEIQKDSRMIPDDYIEDIRYWTGNHYSKFSDIQTYPDNWGCHNKDIVSFIFKERYCTLSEMFSDNNSYITIRIHPLK
jgi:hypothetical protein